MLPCDQEVPLLVKVIVYLVGVIVAEPETPPAATAKSCITDVEDDTLSLSTAIYDLFNAPDSNPWLILILAPA